MLIFLDIDGVLVPAKGWKTPELLKDGFPAFSPKATRALQRLISENTCIALTTSHKANYTIDDWKAIFWTRGINIEHLTCLPANIGSLSRMDEIMNWFHVHPVNEEFVIIDDDTSLNNLPESLKKHLVQTSPYIGLTEELVEAAIAMIISA